MSAGVRLIDPRSPSFFPCNLRVTHWYWLPSSSFCGLSWAQFVSAIIWWLVRLHLADGTAAITAEERPLAAIRIGAVSKKLLNNKSARISTVRAEREKRGIDTALSPWRKDQDEPGVTVAAGPIYCRPRDVCCIARQWRHSH